MNNKAQIVDIVMPIMVLTMGAILLVIGSLIVQEAIDNDVFNNTIAEEVLGDGIEYYKGFDATFALVFLGMIVASAILGMNMDAHPVFFSIIIITIAAIILSAIALSNVFDTFISNTVFDGIRGFFPVTRLVIGNWPFLVLFSVLAWGFGLYFKWRRT